MPFKCKIYEKRPRVCTVWPRQQEDLHYYPNCGFSFDENGMRTGECNRCGECCVFYWWTLDIKSDTEILLDNTLDTVDCYIRKDGICYENRHQRDDVCRFLVEE